MHDLKLRKTTGGERDPCFFLGHFPHDVLLHVVFLGIPRRKTPVGRVTQTERTQTLLRRFVLFRRTDT